MKLKSGSTSKQINSWMNHKKQKITNEMESNAV